MQNPVLNRVWRLFFAKPTITTLKLRHISYLHSSFYLINLIGFPERFSLISAFVYFHASLGTSLIAFSDKSSSTKLVSLRKARGSISTEKKKKNSRKTSVTNSTDLGSLIWNLGIHNVEFHDFSTSQILREINFGHFEAQKLPFWPLEQIWILNF